MFRFRRVMFLISLCSADCSGQQASLQLRSMNVVYCNQRNSLSFTSSGIKQRDLVLATNNGIVDTSSVYFDEYYRRTYYSPAVPGRASIMIFAKERGTLKLIDSFVFRAKRRPPLTAQVSGVSNGDITLWKLRSANCPGAFIQEEFEGRLLPLSGFDILFIRDSVVIAERSHRGEQNTRFKDDSVTLYLINQTQTGDIIWLRNVTQEWNYQRYHLNDIILRVK